MPDGKKLLIVEDDKFLSLVLKSRLEKEGFIVSQAFDGQEGLDMVRATPPDLIILDLIMPKMSGFEFLQAMSLDPQLSKIPVVVGSNLGQDPDIEKANSLGAMSYYVKVRTSIDDLVKILRNLSSGEPQPIQPTP